MKPMFILTPMGWRHGEEVGKCQTEGSLSAWISPWPSSINPNLEPTKLTGKRIHLQNLGGDQQKAHPFWAKTTCCSPHFSPSLPPNPPLPFDVEGDVKTHSWAPNSSCCPAHTCKNEKRATFRFSKSTRILWKQMQMCCLVNLARSRRHLLQEFSQLVHCPENPYRGGGIFRVVYTHQRVAEEGYLQVVWAQSPNPHLLTWRH